MTAIRVSLLQNGQLRQGDEKLIDQWRRESDDELWVDIQQPSHETLEPLIERRKIRALAHITGGGFPGNIPRVLPQGLAAKIRKSSWTVPPLFRLIAEGGNVPDDEMYRTFNMGIGMIVVVAPENLHEVEHSLERRGEVSHLLGSVVPGEGATS